MKYTKGKLWVKLTVRGDSLSVIKWWVDVSLATNNDCRGHNGGMMSLGAGAITSGSWKQKINVRNSTYNKTIGYKDMMWPVLCTLYFIQGKGYTVESNIMLQGNHSTMNLVLNGKISSLKNTKHINVRYLFMKDVINRGEISVEYCPTDKI